VAAVTADSFLAMFAAAEVNGPIFLGGVGFRGKTTATMGTITEGLLFAVAASAPVVGFAGLNSYRIRRFLSYVGLVHDYRLLDIYTEFSKLDFGQSDIIITLNVSWFPRIA
jgi:hypothetical protein